jgi:diguanylate cyclase (GGDEF)-like protein/PAS domain S-box-containing protein
MAHPARKSLSLRAFAYVLAICTAIVAFEGWREWAAHGAALEEARRDVQNLARGIRQHAEDTFEIAGQAVDMVAYELNVAGTSPAGIDEAEGFMRKLMEGSPRLAELTVYDASGRWLASSAPDAPRVPDRSGDGIFIQHRDNPSLEAVIGRPVADETARSILTSVSRRLDDASGRFAGIVVATIDSRYFASVHARVDVGPDGAIMLYDRDGSTITGEPFTSPIATPGVAMFGPRTGPADHGNYEFIPASDGIPRIAGYDRSSRFPLTAVAAVSTSEALADWWQGALLRGLVTLGFTIAAAVQGLWLADQIHRRQRSEAVLAQKEGEFRLLAESASDLVERFTTDGTRTYISPALERLTGYRPEELIGKNAFDIIHEDDRPEVEAAAERMRRGQSEQETVSFRRIHRDGREIWLETSLRIAAEASGQFSVVGVTRDITERKELERQLEGMALRDGLTDLANRRAFDAALAREVARSRRSGAPLSLLMIDADRFKRYNDDNGHLAGDSCLRAIAAVVAGAARRPSDLAARFGGEELALLLPDTDLAAARAIGIDVCRHVEALGIPHGRNLPWNVVTVSIGVATIDPRDEDVVHDGTWLISTADLALYDAKAHGRNQSIAAPRRLRTRLVG